MNRDSVSTYVHMRRVTQCPYTQLYTFWMTTQSPNQLRMHLTDGPFLNQKTYEYIWISYLLIYEHSKNKFLDEKINGMVV